MGKITAQTSRIVLVTNPIKQNQQLQTELAAAAARVISGRQYFNGPETSRFEKRWAAFCGAAGAIGVSSGTDALTLSLLAHDIKKNHEVICPALTSTYTALAISAVGAKPVFVDVDTNTFTVNPTAVEKAINDKTAAIIAVHLYGQPADIAALNKIGRKYHVPVIEDACQAHGAKFRSQIIGQKGTVCFSFYPTKNLGALGDAGAVVSDNETILEKIRILRDGGRVNRYVHQIAGRSSRIDEIQAAFLNVKLDYLKSWNWQRSQIARRYLSELSKCSDIVLPSVISWAKSAWHLFVIQTTQRDELVNYLTKRGIQTQVHYPLAVHQQPAYRDSKISLPNSERLVGQILSLPIYPEMTREDVDAVIRGVKDFINGQ